METKLSKLKAAMATGDTTEALRIAAKFPKLGDAKEPITRAWAALQNQNFYREIGQDPDNLVRIGIAALERRYGVEAV